MSPGREDWGQKSYYTQVRVDPLGEESADVLLHGLLGADAALERVRAVRRYTAEADCLCLLGEVEVRRDQPDVGLAEAYLRDGLTLAEEHELRPRQAHCHIALGKLYRRLGRLDEARAELSAAVSMLRDMEMTRWLPEAEAELDAASSALVD